MEIEVRTFLFPDHREALGELLQDLGYEPSSKAPIEKRDAADAGRAFVLWLAAAIEGAAAAELARAVGKWMREHLPKRRPGGTVRIIYGPNNTPLAEVEVDEADD